MSVSTETLCAAQTGFATLGAVAFGYTRRDSGHTQEDPAAQRCRSAFSEVLHEKPNQENSVERAVSSHDF
jgi:hypothetical protein